MIDLCPAEQRLLSVSQPLLDASLRRGCRKAADDDDRLHGIKTYVQYYSFCAI